MSRFFTFLISALFLLIASVGLCLAEPWQTQIEANLGVNQNQFSNNWQGGGASGFSWVSSLNALTQKQIDPSLHWKHTLKLAFGQSHLQDQTTKDWQLPIKSTDQIDYETVLKLTRGWFLDPVISGRLESQFLDQSAPAKTRNFNPLKLSEAVGAARTLLEKDKTFWDVRLGIVFRQIYNDAYMDALNPAPHYLALYDGGVQLDSDFKAPLNDRLAFASKLTLFQALINSEKENRKAQVYADYWKELDVYWDNTLTGKLATFLSMQLNCQFQYDKEVALGGRFKESLSLGMTYIFSR